MARDRLTAAVVDDLPEEALKQDDELALRALDDLDLVPMPKRQMRKKSLGKGFQKKTPEELTQPVEYDLMDEAFNQEMNEHRRKASIPDHVPHALVPVWTAAKKLAIIEAKVRKASAIDGRDINREYKRFLTAYLKMADDGK